MSKLFVFPPKHCGLAMHRGKNEQREDVWWCDRCGYRMPRSENWHIGLPRP